MDREKTPTPSENSETIYYKPGENPSDTTEPRKTHVITPDTPDKLSKTFYCCGCSKTLLMISYGIRDGDGNYFCHRCY